MLLAVKIAQISRFIERLPAGYGTMIGEAGLGLSRGQRQRLLLARAVYRKPKYLFLDEATTGLHAFTEMTIMDELFDQLKGTTIVIVAHRHSTFEHADNVIVLNDGQVEETGSHAALMGDKKRYYRLVVNQTKLGS